MKSITSSVHPVIYQVNTRVWLTELSKPLGRPASLDDIPDAELDRLVKMGLRAEATHFVTLQHTALGPLDEPLLCGDKALAGSLSKKTS
jgi:hypothetical protein